jgi:hypothetical protein
MATSAFVPHTRIDNSIIDDCAAKIGIYGLGIYVAIKRHLTKRPPAESWWVQKLSADLTAD